MTPLAYRPTALTELVRISDRISFLYVERCTINRENNALAVSRQQETIHIPAASVGVLLLGPGTTVTHQAVNLLADSGSTAVWVGENGVRYYAHGRCLSRSSRLLEAQAAAVSHQRSRLRVARKMYQMRFPDEDVAGLTMQQLRGREGARVRRTYQEQSRRTGVQWSGRNYDSQNWETSDFVNQALSAANSALYGVIHSVIVGLGCSPALGFIHTGNSRSFVYDIADLYKSEISIPVAFDIAAEPVANIGRETRRRMRDALTGGQLLKRCAIDIQALLLESSQTEAIDELSSIDVISLWDEKIGLLPGGTLYEETI